MLGPHTEIGMVTAANIVPSMQGGNEPDLDEKKKCHVCQLKYSLQSCLENSHREVENQKASYKSLTCLALMSGSLKHNKKLET